MRPDLLVEAFNELYPDRPFSFTPVVRYSGKFKGFNANIKMRGSTLTVSLAKQWRQISKDIQLGMVQDLLVRLFKEKRDTTNIRLYLSFMKNVHLAVPKTKTDPFLAETFERLNREFFDDMLETPNFDWMDGTRTVGLYEYGTDTILISKHLARDPELLAYVMYHEMLHKKHKFASKPGRQCHHSRAFREDEAKYPDASRLEQRLGRVRLPRVLRWLF